VRFRSNNLDQEVILEKTKKDFMDMSILGLGARIEVVVVKLKAEVGQ
jgi:hypothetical protein